MLSSKEESKPLPQNQSKNLLQKEEIMKIFINNIKIEKIKKNEGYSSGSIFCRIKGGKQKEKSADEMLKNEEP